MQAPDFGTGSTSSTLTLNSPITGSGNVTFGATSSVASNSQQTIRLNAASSYSGGTTTLHPTGSNANLIVRLGIANALPSSTILAINGATGGGSGRFTRFDLNGFHQTVAGLQNTSASLRSQILLSDAATPATLTIQNSTNHSFSGSVNGTGLSLVKNGTGRQTLAGTNGFSGATTIHAGLLQGVVGGSFTNSAITLASTNGALGVAISDATKTWTCPSLTVAAAGTLEFSFGNIQPASVAALTVTGAVAFQATPTVRIVTDSGIVSGTYPLMTWGSATGTAPTVVSMVNSSGQSALVDGTTASLSLSGTTLNLIVTSVPTIVKANNTNNLNLGSSWVGGTAPNAATTAIWNSTVTAANTTVLGADTTWGGISVSNPGGNVIINAGHTLTLGANATDIGMTSATVNLTLNCPVILGDANAWKIATNRTLTLGGVVSGAFPITKEGAGTALLTAANTFTGDITIGANSGSFDMGGTGTLNAGNFAGAIEMGSGSTFRYYSSTAQILSGELRGAGTLRKENASSLLTLAQANPDFIGTISLHQGRIDLAHLNALGATSAINVTGAATLSSQLDGMTTTVPINLASDFTLSYGRNTSARGTLRFNGLISGTGNLTITTPTSNSANNLQAILLGAQHSYTGGTTITTANAGNTLTVKALQADTLPITSILTLNGGAGSGSGRTVSFDLNGFDQTLAGLTNVTGLNLRNQRIFNTANEPATLTINNTADLSFSGNIMGSDISLNKTGSGAQTLAGSNTHDGITSVSEGILVLGHSLALQNSGFDTSESVLGDATNGLRSTVTSLTLGGLSGSRNFSTNFTTSTGGYSSVTQLILNPAVGVSYQYSGVIANGAAGMSLTKSGLGTQILAGTNTYSGSTNISSGTLRLGANHVLPATPLTLGDATLDVAEFSDAVGTLDLMSNATIEFLANGNLAFTDSSAIDWTDHSTTAPTLTIEGDFVAGSSLRFGTTSTALTAAQLACISVSGYGSCSLNSGGYLIATRLTAYAHWASTRANNQSAGHDFDGDGVANGIEYLLGGTSTTKDRALLPGLTTAGGNRIFRFVRDQNSIDPTTTVMIETSDNLHGWSNSHAVPDTEGTTTAGVTVEKNAPAVGRDTITFILPSSATETFVRLKVIVP
jgi:autotransporter-associated beta strand protein